MTEEASPSPKSEGGPVEISIDGIDYRVCLVESDPDAYDRFYNATANPILWLIQHYLWDLANAPDIRQEQELDAWDYGYQTVNRRHRRRAVLRQIEGQDRPLVMLHDYHLYTVPGMIPEQRRDALLHFHPFPGPAGQLARAARPDSRGDLPRHARQRHHRLPHQRLLPQLPALLRRADGGRRRLPRRPGHTPGGETLVRAYPLSIDAKRLERAAASEEVAEAEREVIERRREYLILRVDRADLSKNVLRGFTAFDTFLQQHPDFGEKVTFIARPQPSRQECRVRRVPGADRSPCRGGQPPPRHHRLDADRPQDQRHFHHAVARYKHFDLLMVNAIFDGMNLVAKEAPVVNTRSVSLMLSENTGSHEELADCALSVNPFDIQEQADHLTGALTHLAGEAPDGPNG